MFFKGYVPTKDKACLKKFKNRTDLDLYDSVKNLNEFAGVLEQDTVLIDIDDKEQSDVMFKIVQDLNLRCRVYETTRGKHFLFKNSGLFTKCKTHTKTAIGLEVDIKIGLKNSYSILKYDGKERPIIWDNCGSEEKAQEVPKWLLPVNSKYDLWELGEGNRNNTLFEYILVLQGYDFSKEEIRECLTLTNQYVLEYRLDDSELQVILRDESFSKQTFFKNKQFLFDKFAMYLKNEFHVKRINGQLYMYKEGYYQPCEHNLEQEMIKIIPSLNESKRKEVFKYMELISDVYEDYNVNDRYIAFKNGVYDIFDKKFIKNDPSIVVTNQIPHAFVKSAYCSTVDIMLDKLACQNKNIRALLEEIVGYCFYRRNELGKFFVLTGDKSNGKSTFLGMLGGLLGDDNISALDMNELNQRFKNTMLAGKLANIGDDISDEFIRDTSVLKKLVTGEKITAEIKGGKVFHFKNYAKFVFTANSIPRLGKGKDVEAVMRRMVIVPFNAQFSKNDADFNPFLKYELQEENAMEYLIQIGIKGLHRVLKNNSFTECDEVDKMLKSYQEDCDPFLQFIDEYNYTSSRLVNEFTSDVYRRYKMYCEESSLKPISLRMFTQRIKKEFRLTTAYKYDKNNKQRKAYVNG